MKIIAEVGCNHKGDMEIAHQLIKSAAQFCNVDTIKFQKRTPTELLTPAEYNLPHPNLYHAYGDTYGAHREALEFTVEQHRQLKEWCEECGVVYSSSVWDMTSTKEIVSLKPELIKIPSACNLKFDVLRYLCDNFYGDIHLSFGMTTKTEEEEIISFFEDRGRNHNLVIYSCTSGYPVSFENICLKEILRLKDTFIHRVKAIGFSGHHLGIAVDIAALAFEADYFERHFTLDRTWKGTDHAASLEPDGMRRLVRDIHNVSLALTYKKSDILDIEQVQRDKLKRL